MITKSEFVRQIKNWFDYALVINFKVYKWREGKPQEVRMALNNTEKTFRNHPYAIHKLIKTATRDGFKELFKQVFKSQIEYAKKDDPSYGSYY